MSHYKYPESLYCIVCDLDVKPTIETLEDIVTNDVGRKIGFEYQVAACPYCGNILCKRDYDFSFVKAINFKEEGSD